MKSTYLLNTLTASAIGVLLLTSCGKTNTIEVNYLCAQTEDDSNWGMIGPDGKMLFVDEFENCPSSAFNGYFTVNEEDGIAVYRAEKKPKLVPGLEGLYDAGFFSEGLIPVTRQDSRIEMVDKDGNTKFTLMPVDGREIVHVNGFFNGGVAQFQLEDGFVGAVNTNGDIVINPIWNTIYWFNDGVAYASRDNEREGALYIIDNAGDEICRLASSFHPYNYAFKHGISPAYKGSDNDRVSGFINKQGEFARVSSKINEILEWTNDYFTYTNDDEKCGVMSMKGDVLIRPKYEAIMIIGDNHFLAKKTTGTYAIVNLEGEELKRLHGDIERLLPASLDIFSSKFALIYENGDSEYFLLDNKGEYNRSEPYEGINFYTPSQTVDSRYFNVDAAAQKLVSEITDNGYGSYTLGTAMSEYCTGDAEDYRNSTAIGGEETDNGTFTISTQLRSNNSLVYDSTPSAYYYTWAFSPKSKLDYIDVTLYPGREVNGLADAVKQELGKRGWEISGENATKGNTKINIAEDDVNLNLTISRK